MKFGFSLGFVILLFATFLMGVSQPSEVADGRVKLTWTSDDNPLRQEQIGLFNKQNPKVKLGLDPMNQGMEKVIVQSLAGVGPDLLDCRDANQLAAYVKAGIVWDVTEELAKRGIRIEEQTWKCMHPMAIREGRVYGVPTNAAANGIWINKDAFAEAGMEVPSGPITWDQFTQLALRLTKRRPDGRPERYGVLIDWWNAPHFLYSFGARIFSEDGTRCTLDSEQAAKAIQYMHDLVYVHKVTPSPAEEAGMASAGGWGSGTINLFGAGRGAMALGGRWWLANMRNFEGLNLTVMESPNGGTRASSSAGRATLINARSKNRELALEFLIYLASPEYCQLINRQADGIAAFKEQCEGDSFLHNPDFPKEDYNEKWRDLTEFALGSESSPYVNGNVVNRIIEKQIDLVKSRVKPASQAMADAAKLVNAQIEKNLSQDPQLKAKWLAAQEASR